VKSLLHSGRALLEDLASTLLFFVLYKLTDNLFWSVVTAIALAVVQLGWHIAKRRRITALQWVSLFLVVASGAATLTLHDPLFMKLLPTALYLLAGIAMLQRGWMMRYMPPRAIQFLPDLIVRFGFVWAGLMFFSAALNLVLAFGASVLVWGSVMTLWGTVSKPALFFAQYGLMKSIGMRRRRASQPPVLLQPVAG
jgi:intracellular septation protein